MGDYCIKCEERRERLHKLNKPLDITDEKGSYFGFICYWCSVGETIDGNEITEEMKEQQENRRN